MSQQQSGQTKPKVFVIDDNPADLVMARLLLNKEGCEPILCNNPIQALKDIKTVAPDLVLLDLEMPGLTGIEILKRIRRLSSLERVPIIMVTNKSEVEDVRTAIASGANDYIVKPLDPDIFQSKLWRLLKGYNNNKEREQNWVEYMLSKTSSQAQLQVDAEIISIGEVSISLRTHSSVPVNFNFYLKLPFLDELDIKTLPLSVLSCEESGDFYHIKCNIVGLAEHDLQKIRLFCRTLLPYQKKAV